MFRIHNEGIIAELGSDGDVVCKKYIEESMLQEKVVARSTQGQGRVRLRERGFRV
jgi:hypothetical protein